MKIPGRAWALGPGVDGMGALVIDGVGGHVVSETLLGATTTCQDLCTPSSTIYDAALCTSECCGQAAGCGAATGSTISGTTWAWILGGLGVAAGIGLVALMNWNPR